MTIFGMMIKLQALGFPYSPVVRFFVASLFGGLILFILFMGDSILEIGDSPYFLLLLLVIALFLFYFCYKYLIPVLQGKIAMELDQEKLQFLMTKMVIYWKDVADIRTDNYSNTKVVYFTMLDGRKDIGISLAWIKGDNVAVYNSIVEYFNNAKL